MTDELSELSSLIWNDLQPDGREKISSSAP